LTVTLTPAERDRFAEQSDVAAFSAMLSRIDTRSASCTLQDEQVSQCCRVTVLGPFSAVGRSGVACDDCAQAAIMQVLEREVGIDKTDDMVRQALVVWLESQQLERMSPVQAEFEPPEVAEASASFAEAKSLHDRNLLLEAEQPARRAVELRARALGADSGETWAAKLLLASLLKKQTKLDEAKPLYEEVLAAARQVLGNDHEETLACMNNLAVLLKQQGKLDDARALYEEALQYKRSKFGVHHASTLTSMSNLAGLLKAQGRLEEARVLYEESLLGHRTTLGPLHPNTLTDIWNFALFLSKVCIQGGGELGPFDFWH
jgi:tetratricopeptide (TPR) repeat protein